MEENLLSPGDYVKIVKQRIWYLIVPFILVVVISSVVALALPAIYKSTANILIEQREIPEEYVLSSMTTFAEQRMQSINQRVLTSTRLLELIKQFNLYEDLQQKETIDEVIEKMRDDIALTPVNVEIADRKSGRTASATIAFTLSYEGKDPKKVQQVANTITSLFLKEDIKVRKDQASSTSEFLKDEKDRILTQVNDYEKQLSEFKEKNVNSLPEMFQVNMQALNNSQRNIEQTKENMRALKEKEGALSEELANTIKDYESTQVGQKDDDERRLEALKMELINLKTKFSDLYPDVKKIKQEIIDLEKKVETSKKEKDEDDMIKNPAYVTLSSRLAGLKSDIESVKISLKDLTQQETMYQARIAATPAVEEKYNALLTERNVLKAKLGDLQSKMMEADVAQVLESKQKGERFTLIEAARLPEKPFKPNRLAIVLIGIVLGLGAGVGLASIAEFSDSSFRDEAALARATGYPVLTEIPIIVTEEDRAKKRVKTIVIFAGIIAAVIIGLIVFDQFVMDFDVLMAKVSRKLS